MRKVVLGRTGLSATVMGLGGGGDSRLGRAGGENDGASVRLVRAALDQGINFIDTAEAYGTEGVIGEALSQVARDSVILSTKKKTYDEANLSPRTVTESLEQSLRRLRTEYVDIYHLHGVRPAQYVELRERLLPTLQKLREQGKIRFLGITEAFAADPTHDMLVRALQDDLWDVVMVGFNLLNQSARDKIFPLTLARNVGTLIMFAVRRALSRPDRLRELLGDLAARGKIGRELVDTGLDFLLHAEGARSLPDAAYRFVRDEPGAHVVLSGTGNVEHLLENVASLARPALPGRDRARLIELFRGVEDVSGH
jgi:aryl-alcohol dehydrogenase-like predicted oxidoreductase